MATNGFVNTPMNVSIVMASALVPNAAHTIVFSGPLAGPDELQINSGRTLTFNNTNWNVPQLVNVTPKRPGTLHMNYRITSPYTRAVKTGSVELFAVVPQNIFTQVSPYFGSTQGAFWNAWQEIGQYEATMINTILKLTVTGIAGGFQIQRKNPSGTFSGFSSGVNTVIPEIGTHKFYAKANAPILISSGSHVDTSPVVTSVDANGTTPWNYDRMRIDLNGSTASPTIVSQHIALGPTPPGTNPVSLTTPSICTQLIGISDTFIFENPAPVNAGNSGSPDESHYSTVGIGSGVGAAFQTTGVVRKQSAGAILLLEPQFRPSKLIPLSGAGPVGDADTMTISAGWPGIFDMRLVFP